MRLTTKGQYAVRAMVNLACRGEDRPVSLKDISVEEDISLAYLEQGDGEPCMPRGRQACFVEGYFG
jgi:hypothetical protein